MKCTTRIDPTREEEILIFAHKRTARIEEIENFVSREKTALFGYRNEEIYPLDPKEIVAFTVREGKVSALTEKEEFIMRERLYMLEDILGNDFLKINQSCIANIKKIQKFEASFAGALMVCFRGGYRDYVSRRRLKDVKERLGIK